MSTFKSTLFVCLLTCFLNCSVSEVVVELKAKNGDDVTLPCSEPGDAAITLLRWSRPDLNSDDYVYYFRDDRTYENYQHESFRGRVELTDPQMKGGDYSIILKNVTMSDTGIYKCYIGKRNIGKSSELISNITLKVEHAADTAGDVGNEGGGNGRKVGLAVGLSVGGALLLSLLGLLAYLHA